MKTIYDAEPCNKKFFDDCVESLNRKYNICILYHCVSPSWQIGNFNGFVYFDIYDDIGVHLLDKVNFDLDDFCICYVYTDNIELDHINIFNRVFDELDRHLAVCFGIEIKHDEVPVTEIPSNCPNCGAVLKKHLKKCIYCGTEF